MAEKKYSPNNMPMGVMMLSGGVAASIAEIITIPLDTAKVRLHRARKRVRVLLEEAS